MFSEDGHFTGQVPQAQEDWRPLQQVAQEEEVRVGSSRRQHPPHGQASAPREVSVLLLLRPHGRVAHSTIKF